MKTIREATYVYASFSIHEDGMIHTPAIHVCAGRDPQARAKRAAVDSFVCGFCLHSSLAYTSTNNFGPGGQEGRKDIMLEDF